MDYDTHRLSERVTNLESFMPANLLMMSKLVAEIAFALGVKPDHQDMVGLIKKMQRENEKLNKQSRLLRETLYQLTGIASSALDKEKSC